MAAANMPSREALPNMPPEVAPSKRMYPREISVGAFFALVFGLLAFPLTLVPYSIWVIAIPLSGLGLTMALLALLRAFTGKILGRVLPLFAVPVCAAALTFSFMWPEWKDDLKEWAAAYIPSLRGEQPATLEPSPLPPQPDAPPAQDASAQDTPPAPNNKANE